MFKTNYKLVEENVSTRPGSYPGLEEAALLTSEEDFRAIFNSIPESSSWIEFGSGHGLGPLLFGHLHPQGHSTGIEFEESRYKASLELKDKSGLQNVSFIHADLLNCDIPEGDVYFFYFPTGIVLDRILFELGKRTGSFKLIAIESHGDFLERLKKENWLKVIQEIPLKSSRHNSHALVFEKCGTKSSSLHDYSFQKNFLILQDSSGEWIGETYGLEWLNSNQFQLLVPPRSFLQEDVKKIVSLEGIESRFHPALRLRHLKQLTFKTSQGEFKGALRKIYVRPSFRVEISSGQLVEWEEISQIYWETSLCYDSSSGYFSYPHVV